MGKVDVDVNGVSRNTREILSKMIRLVHNLVEIKGYFGTKKDEKIESVCKDAVKIAREMAVDEWEDTRTPCTTEQYVQWICQLLWDAICDEGDPFPHRFDAPANDAPMSGEFLKAIGMSETEVEEEVQRFRQKRQRESLEADRRKQERKTKDAELADARQQYESRLEELRTKKDAELADTRQQLETQLQELRTTKEELRTTKEELADVRQRLEDGVNAASTRASVLQSVVDQLQQELDNSQGPPASPGLRRKKPRVGDS
ncbi:hypothetical protein KVR01_004733 [Diaporthe batatas]|uniref:uncharacterized protein n=1 Tax=Diaporthe batatas TaxID=748121 RepID=UPI001D0449FF|nr:uncharacterized protein KVR01_004733 [Diaporthe batatas]KAG8166181.1 hypothetical protein KVR01_004733 [Diaporthe batatas]